MSFILTGEMIRELAEHAGFMVSYDADDDHILEAEYTLQDGSESPVREDNGQVNYYQVVVVEHDADEGEVFPLGDPVN